MELQLVVRSGDQPGQAFRIREGADLTIGRMDGCEIRLADPGVSRLHCRIVHTGPGLQVTDLESANGTAIDGVFVQTGNVGPGQLLAVGPVVLGCASLEAAAPAEDGGQGDATPPDEPGMNTVLRAVVDTRAPHETLGEGEHTRSLDPARAQRNLAIAYSVSKLLGRSRDVETLSKDVIQSILQATRADRAALLLRDRQDPGRELDVVAARGRDGPIAPDSITISRTVVRDVLESGASTLSQDASTDTRYREGNSVIQQKIRSVLCAPVATDDRILGVLYADTRSLPGAFAANDLELLALIGNQAGIAIHRAQLMAELERFFFDTIRAMVATIDAKDGYTHRHSERVAALAVKLARELGTPKEELESIELAGLLHDVGKIGVPEAILNKPGPLTREELSEMRKHPVHGVSILRHIKSPRLEPILPGVRHHHERWDGTGYPDGLAGDEIPFLGRLLAVADVLDALSAPRSYREAFTLDEAIATIREESGRHFDPQLAHALGRLYERGELEMPELAAIAAAPKKRASVPESDSLLKTLSTRPGGRTAKERKRITRR